jgi:hypothetical protein
MPEDSVVSRCWDEAGGKAPWPERKKLLNQRSPAARDEGDSARLAARIERGVKGEARTAPRGGIPDFHQKTQDRRSWE